MLQQKPNTLGEMGEILYSSQKGDKLKCIPMSANSADRHLGNITEDLKK